MPVGPNISPRIKTLISRSQGFQVPQAPDYYSLVNWVNWFRSVLGNIVGELLDYSEGGWGGAAHFE